MSEYFLLIWSSNAFVSSKENHIFFINSVWLFKKILFFYSFQKPCTKWCGCDCDFEMSEGTTNIKIRPREQRWRATTKRTHKYKNTHTHRDCRERSRTKSAQEGWRRSSDSKKNRSYFILMSSGSFWHFFPLSSTQLHLSKENLVFGAKIHWLYLYREDQISGIK